MEKNPLVVRCTCARTYSSTVWRRPVASGGRRSLVLASMKGSASPRWPTTTCRPGNRSKTPARTRRSTCRPVSMCQPQAVVAIVQEAAVAEPVDQGALEAEPPHGALQLGRGGGRVRGGKGREGGEAVRMPGHGLRQAVVLLPGPGGRVPDR